MASFNPLVQRLLLLMGIKLEVGKLSFTTTGLTYEVPTKMSKIFFGLGMTSDATGVSQDAVITSGAVTFTRPSGGTSGASFNYIMMGW